MSELMAARAQMGSSLAFHINFAVIGIGMPLVLLIAEGLWLRTGRDVYHRLARVWSKAFAVAFAIGAVSGTMLSFEIGPLWPRFMEFAGGIIGMPFSLEGFAFFLEGIFLSIYLYGWDRLSRRAHYLCGLPLLLGGFASTFFVVAANSWMNTPQGFALSAAGEVVDVDPIAAMFNPALFTRYTHMLIAALVTTGFTVAAVYAWGMLKGRRDEYHRTGLAIGLAVAGIPMPVRLATGDLIAVQVTENQPLKLATMEGLFQTTEGLPMTLFGIPDEETRTVRGGIEIPYLLSLLAYNDPTATVQGMEEWPEEDWPNPVLVHLAYDTMITRLAPAPARPRRPLRVAAAAAPAAAPAVPVGTRRRGARRVHLRRDGLGHHGVGAPAVGRLRGAAHRGQPHDGHRHPALVRRLQRGLRPAHRARLADPGADGAPPVRAHRGRARGGR